MDSDFAIKIVEVLRKLLLFNEKEPFVFTGLLFWLFFGVVLIGNALLYKINRLRNLYLFLMSLFFYYKAGGYFFSLLLLSTIIDYSVALRVYVTKNQFKRRFWLMISIFLNLGVLAYFKYSFFFLAQVNHLFDTSFIPIDYLAWGTNVITGSHFDIDTIVLPVGISFFTFQTISYTVDVYRGKLKPVRNIIDFGFYVSFFPQLVAGPIVRAWEFIPQLYKKFSLTERQLWHAVFLILAGLFKKMVISDYLALNFIDRVFDNPYIYSNFENLAAVLGYSLQIYCDFSGYTDIATGVALLLGFRLPINFNSPYKSISLTDFWRRWHISLSFWLRDYLYISLGGNRKGNFRRAINLLITMFLGGLWHGASWKFVIWGTLHGVGLIVDKIVRSYLGKRFLKMPKYIGFAFTFVFVILLWVIFRAPDMDTAVAIVHKSVSGWSWNEMVTVLKSYPVVYGLILFGYIIHWIPFGIKEDVRGGFINLPVVVKLLIVVLFLFFLYQVKSSDVQPFIYFRF